MALEQSKTNYDRILDLIPEGIIETDRKLVITAINLAARRILGISGETELREKPIREIMDESGFLRMLAGERSRFSESIEQPEKNRCLELSYLCDPEQTTFLCLMRDVTQQRQQQEMLERNQQRAVALADAINEKHLRLVHDIAGLLGEDAVETQAAVNELKEAVLPEREKRDG